MNTTEQLNTIINIKSSIIAVGMIYNMGENPFNIRFFYTNDEKYACSKYHGAVEVSPIALITSMNVGVKASVNGFTKDLFFAEIAGEGDFSGLENCVVSNSEYRRVKDTPYALITVYNLDTKKRMGVPVENVTLKISQKFKIIPLYV